MGLISVILLAFGPGLAIMLHIYLKDKHEKEPLLLLIISFLYGGLSTLITWSISFPLNVFLITKPDDVVSQFINAFFKVALVEEFSKFLFVRFVLFHNKNFNEPFDGIVYAVMVSMGFASVENLLYVYQYGVVTGILRMFTAVPAHAVFGIMMGFYAGRARFQNATWLYSALALLVPALFHGTYDYFWFIAEIKGVYSGIWLVAVVSLVVGFILAKRAIKMHQHESPFAAK